jgi:phosphate starvation-inducible protein PhoH and related proteins
MSRTPRKSSLTTSDKPQLERQAKRIAREQKQLERELVGTTTGLTGARSRAIKVSDVARLDPLTDTQADFFDAYADGEEAFVLYGSAGTGKSFLALYHALLDVLEPESQYKKIIIVRSSVQGRDQGHLPGDAAEKMEQFELPYHSICAELLGRKDAYEKLKGMGKIEFLSTSFLRGTTFNDCIIVADEIQNENFATIGTLVTRVGKNSKLIIMGDGLQDDLVHSKHDVSGFRDFLTVTKSMSEFRHFRFTADDIVRSGLCKSWIVNCEKLGL